jgi:hypothetical protein
MADPIKWYLKPAAIVVAILAVGPFAIPLVWVSPAFKKWQKTVITVLLILLTIWLVGFSADAYKSFHQQILDLQAIMK